MYGTEFIVYFIFVYHFESNIKFPYRYMLDLIRIKVLDFITRKIDYFFEIIDDCYK